MTQAAIILILIVIAALAGVAIGRSLPRKPIE